MRDFMSRVIFWILRNPRKRNCRKFCVTCEYIDWCRRDKSYEDGEKNETQKEL